jgi:hypothetical protein
VKFRKKKYSPSYYEDEIQKDYMMTVEEFTSLIPGIKFPSTEKARRIYKKMVGLKRKLKLKRL